MNRIFAMALLILVVGAAGGVLAADGAESLEHWAQRAPIKFPADGENRLVEFPLTNEIFHYAKSDLSDLRVAVDETDEKVGYVLRRAADGGQRETYLARLYNRTYLEGRQSAVTADFTQKALKDHLDIITAGDNFRRKTKLEGSDDEKDWQTIREGAYLIKVRDDQHYQDAYEKYTVYFSPNNWRYLRVTVFNDPEDRGPVEIREIRAWRYIERPPETVPVAVANRSLAAIDNGTEIVFDLGYSNLPLHALKLDFAEPDFFRRIRISGRQTKDSVLSVPVESGPPREKKVETPWQHVAVEAIYRFSTGGNADESLEINLEGCRYRYLRLHIDNGGDPPLQLREASFSRLATFAAFQPKFKGTYFLYFGNHQAETPSYDLGHYDERLRRNGVIQAGLGPVEKLTHDEKKIRPWSEQHEAILWFALLAVVGVLGLLIFRQFKGAPKEED